MTAEQYPNPELSRSSRRDEQAGPRGNNVALVAGMAFAFGVLLHGCVALSLLDENEGGAAIADDAPVVAPAVPTAEPSPTPSPLPDRTDCEEIRGTDYRSGSEREFFLANCIEQATPTPVEADEESPPLDGGTSTEPDTAATPANGDAGTDGGG